MDYRIFAALQRFKGLLDYMLSGLRQDLDSHIVRYKILFFERPAEVILRLRSCRKTDLYLLEAYLYQLVPELKLFA